MAIWKVGMGSDVAFVEGESADAAAMFYGKDVGHGNAIAMAAVYEKDGEPYEGDTMPWAKYALDQSDAVFAEFEDKLARFADQVLACRYVGE